MTHIANATPPAAVEEMAKLTPHQRHQGECIAVAPAWNESPSTVPSTCGECVRADDPGIKSTAVPLSAGGCTTSAVAKTSLLTPLVAEHLALSTPSASIVSSDDQQQQDSAAVNKSDANDAQRMAQADAEPDCEAENALRTKTLKRNRRALFTIDAEHSGSSGMPSARPDGAPESVSSSDATLSDITSEPLDEQKPSGDHEVDLIVNSLPPAEVDLHEARLRREFLIPTTAVTRNAFDDDPVDESTLLIRKKWKRSLHQTSILSGEHQASDTELFVSLSQPSRPSFTRSMSSHSVFISKPSSTFSVPSGVSTASSTSAQTQEATIHQLVLPTVRSAVHPDLNVISPQTVSRLLNGEFNTQLASYELIDCRFSYEHEGGSLRGAQSLCDPASVEQTFLWNPSKDCKRTALVFYCEFSANRAPKMLRHVRNLDRWIHAEKYPVLFYPELYLIDGGYKNCFEIFKNEICEPQSYISMNHADFVESCKREFALWRKHWKAHKTSACAAKFQIHHHHQRPATSGSQISDSSNVDGTAQKTRDDEEEDFILELPALHPPVTLRSFSEML